jgi:hypothetical protein
MDDATLEKFGKRIQRCYGCFIAYHLKDMYLGEDVTFFCEHCKDDTMSTLTISLSCSIQQS